MNIRHSIISFFFLVCFPLSLHPSDEVALLSPLAESEENATEMVLVNVSDGLALIEAEKLSLLKEVDVLKNGNPQENILPLIKGVKISQTDFALRNPSAQKIIKRTQDHLNSCVSYLYVNNQSIPIFAKREKNCIKIFDLENLSTPIKELKITDPEILQQGSCNLTAFVPNKKNKVACVFGNKFIIYDLNNTQDSIYSGYFYTNGLPIAWSTDGTQFAFLEVHQGNNPIVTVYDIENKQTLCEIIAPHRDVSISFSNNDRFLTLWSNTWGIAWKDKDPGNYVIVWDILHNKEFKKINLTKLLNMQPNTLDVILNSIVPHPYLPLFVISGLSFNKYFVKIINIYTSEIHDFYSPSNSTHCEWSADGSQLALIGNGFDLYVADFEFKIPDTQDEIAAKIANAKPLRLKQSMA